jgi:imidazoleglycerol-phosphate dehydratase / histidinol-phosphatase
MRRIAFIDRDGTILAEPPDEQIDAMHKLRFLPGAIRGLRTLQHELGYTLVLVSNQDGLGTTAFPYAAFEGPHRLMLDVLASEDVRFERICIDPSLPEQQLPTRKPGIGMVEDLRPMLDPSSSVVIGDRDTDAMFARNLGIPCILLADATSKPMATGSMVPERSCTSWDEIVQWLRGRGRRVTITRVTAETSIAGSLSLDGPVMASISTGVAFFDHMLHQIAVHGSLELELHVQGDLDVDDHHTIEDTALALGEAIRTALGNKHGIGRYGFVLPMDEARTTLAIDLSGRPMLRWNVPRADIAAGGFRPGMAEHFFRSLSDGMRCALHVTCEGVDDHHMIESIFKAFGRALRMAVARVDAGLPSSKGVL